MADTGSEKAISTTEAKQNLGRGTFARTRHEGRHGDPTAFAALNNAAAGSDQKPPNLIEKLLVFQSNSSEYRSLKGAGWTDDQIYEQLKDR